MKYPEPTPSQKRAIVQFFKRVSLDRVLKQKQEEKKNKENSENVI